VGTGSPKLGNYIRGPEKDSYKSASYEDHRKKEKISYDLSLENAFVHFCHNGVLYLSLL
jgi:hypothetical protein